MPRVATTLPFISPVDWSCCPRSSAIPSPTYRTGKSNAMPKAIKKHYQRPNPSMLWLCRYYCLMISILSPSKTVLHKINTHTLIANNMEDWNRDQKRWQSGEGGGGGEGAPQTQLNVCFAAEQRWSMCSTWYVYLSRSRLSSSLSQFKCNVCAFCFIECLASSHYTHRQTEDRRRRQRERLWGGEKIRWRQMKPPSIDIVNISPNSRLYSWLKRQTEKKRERERGEISSWAHGWATIRLPS